METISLLKFSKGHNSIKNEGGVTFLISAHRLMVLYICSKFRENTSKVIELLGKHNFPTKIFKGA